MLPDGQVRAGVPIDHWRAAGNFIAKKQPDVVVAIGDLWDFPSLSSYDKGKRAIEGRRVSEDFDAGRRAVDLLESRVSRVARYRPRKVFVSGNHEFRAARYMNDNPQIDTLPDVAAYMKSLGWETHPYLRPVEIDGISYCHLFARTSTGRVTESSQRFGAPNAVTQARANMKSCTAGHKPGFDFGVVPGDGRILHSLIAGSFYQHDEDYMTAQGHHYWRGLILKHGVRNGEYDLCQVGMDFLRGRYGR